MNGWMMVGENIEAIEPGDSVAVFPCHEFMC